MRYARKHYDENVVLEWERLVSSPYRKLEFDTTLHFLDKHLPRKGTVLDAGGGPGRYAIELARRGYRVALLDLSPVTLDFARHQFKRAGVEDRIWKIVKGSAEDLSDFNEAPFNSNVSGPCRIKWWRKRGIRLLENLFASPKLEGLPLFAGLAD